MTVKLDPKGSNCIWKKTKDLIIYSVYRIWDSTCVVIPTWTETLSPPPNLDPTGSVSEWFFLSGCQLWPLGNPSGESICSWCHGPSTEYEYLECYPLPEKENKKGRNNYKMKQKTPRLQWVVKKKKVFNLSWPAGDDPTGLCRSCCQRHMCSDRTGGKEVKKRLVFHMGNEGGLSKSKKHQTKSVVNNKK